MAKGRLAVLKARIAHRDSVGVPPGRGGPTRFVPDQALVGLLRTTPLLAGVPRDGVVRIASRMRRRRLPAGTVVIKQGEPTRALYLLASGRLEVTVAGGDAESPRSMSSRLQAGSESWPRSRNGLARPP